jgi:hypothetical protein
MKRRLLIWAFSLCAAASLCAQTNPPLRLAIVLEAAQVSTNADASVQQNPQLLAIINKAEQRAQAAANLAPDLLTAELSKRDGLQLLERTEIERLYREQALSRGNQDFLKLGQLLGADGLLLLQPISEGTNQFLAVRLVAVKPGVVLKALRSDWPVTDVNQWTIWLANHFAPLFPKLGVLAKDALPISVVNLRSAISSKEQENLERQLTVLSTERLTREKELFVLERRRMDALVTEKDLAGTTESAFWNGSYLLEGVLDRDGYSKDTMTLNARLVPPKGGAPVEIAIQGPRKNPAGLVEQLTKQILQAMRRQSTATEWNPTEEAAKYYEEARWALKWGLLKEAQAAAESAWALGKRDLDCTLLRVRAYMADAWQTADLYWRVTSTAEAESDLDLEFKRLTNKYPGKVLFDQAIPSIM